MRSRISFCNGHVLKKDITRFAPLWAVYTVFLVVWVFNNSISMTLHKDTQYLAWYVSRNMSNISLMFLFYGFGCATLLFGDLFKTRTACGLHAMPLRRETWFGTHMMAGILFAAVPNTLIALALALFLGDYAFVAGLWWLVVTAQFLFHFALAVLCVMLSGNLLGHAAAFGTIELFSMLIYGIYEVVYQPLLYGLRSNNSIFEFFSPACWWTYNDWLQWDIQDVVMTTEVYSYDKYVSAMPYEPEYIYKGLVTEEWIYLGVCVALAIGFAALALALYRRRKLEWAGDFIVSKPMRWVFLILGSMYAAIVVPVAGFVVGFFGILMLSEKRVKVFRKKNWLAFGITAGAVILTIVLTLLDPAGVITRIPAKEQIEYVTLNPDWGNAMVVTEDVYIQSVLDAHGHALENREWEGDTYTLDVEYTLKNGSTLRRHYVIEADAPALAGIERYLSQWDVVFPDQTPQSIVANLEEAAFNVEKYQDDGGYITTSDVYVDPADFEELLEAIYKDCQEGNMAQNYAFHEGTNVRLTLRYSGEGVTGSERYSLNVYQDSIHTMAFLEQYMQ